MIFWRTWWIRFTIPGSPTEEHFLRPINCFHIASFLWKLQWISIKRGLPNQLTPFTVQAPAPRSSKHILPFRQAPRLSKHIYKLIVPPPPLQVSRSSCINIVADISPVMHTLQLATKLATVQYAMRIRLANHVEGSIVEINELELYSLLRLTAENSKRVDLRRSLGSARSLPCNTRPLHAVSKHQ